MIAEKFHDDAALDRPATGGGSLADGRNAVRGGPRK